MLKLLKSSTSANHAMAIIIITMQHFAGVCQDLVIEVQMIVDSPLMGAIHSTLHNMHSHTC